MAKDTTEFHKSDYDALIGYLKRVDDAINTDPLALGPTAELRLDSHLSTTIRPGSEAWSIAKAFADQAGVFGNSAHQQYTLTEADLRAFFTALKNAEDVFEDTDDLATYSATKFLNDYPDVSGNPTTA